MLPSDTCVLFVDADCVLDCSWATIESDIVAIEVVDGAEAIASELETVGKSAHAVLSNIEGELAWVRMFGGSVGNNHLGH